MKLIYRLSDYLVVGSTETGLPTIDEGIVEIPDDFVYSLPVYNMDGILVGGTFLSAEIVADLATQVVELADRKQQIIDYLLSIVGKNFADCTELERWRLMAVLLFFHGILDANGNIKPLAEWKPL